MSELRAVALERHGSGIEATQTDAEMEAEGFRLLHQISTRCGDRAVNVRIYERKPPTLLEAAKACISMWHGGERGGVWLRLPEITILEEAIAREEAS